MQYFGFEYLPAPVKQTNTTVRLPAGFHKRVNGLGFSSTSAIDCDLTTTGANGLDTGALAAFKLYFVYLVNNSGSPAVVTSLAAPSTGPTGFTAYELIYAFYSNESSQIGSFVSIEGDPVSGTEDRVVTIGATTTPPTKGTTQHDSFLSWRNGEYLFFHYKITQTSSGSAGSGAYLFPLPSGIQIDTSWYQMNESTVLGEYMGWYTSGSRLEGHVAPYDASNLWLIQNASTGLYVGSASGSLANSSLYHSFTGSVKINGWKNTPLKDL